MGKVRLGQSKVKTLVAGCELSGLSHYGLYHPKKIFFMLVNQREVLFIIPPLFISNFVPYMVINKCYFTNI